MTRSLHDALQETLGLIQRALDRIRAGDNAEAELHNVRAYLVNILELVERDPWDRSRIGRSLARGAFARRLLRCAVRLDALPARDG